MAVLLLQSLCRLKQVMSDFGTAAEAVTCKAALRIGAVGKLWIIAESRS